MKKQKFSEVKKDIAALIINGDTSKALKILMQSFEGKDEKRLNQIILLRSQQEQIKYDLNTGPERSRDIQIEQNKVNISLLRILDEVGENERLKDTLLISKNELDKAENSKQWSSPLKIILLISSLLLCLSLFRLFNDIKPGIVPFQEQISGIWIQEFPHDSNKISLARFQINGNAFHFSGNAYDLNLKKVGEWSSASKDLIYQPEEHHLTYIYGGYSTKKPHSSRDAPGLGQMQFKTFSDGVFKQGYGSYRSISNNYEAKEFTLVKVDSKFLADLNLAFPKDENGERQLLKTYLGQKN